MVNIRSIFIVFEDLATVLVICDLRVSRVRPSYERLHVVRDRYVVLREHGLEFPWTHVSAAQFPNRVTQFLLLLCSEPVVPSQVHVRGAEASERGRLVVDGRVLVLLGIHVHVSLVARTHCLIRSLLGQRLHETLRADLLGLNLRTFVNVIIPFICAFPLVPDWRCRGLVSIDDIVVEGLVQDIGVPEPVGARPLARVHDYRPVHSCSASSLFGGHI